MKRSHALEAITVCIGHDDFLHETVKWNSQHFDRWIVVTEASDHRTREVCRKFNLEVLLTDDGKRHGTFNKGRMISRALQLTSEKAWRLHLDADIALPNGFRHLLQTADLHEDFIYGADRVDVFSWEDWQKLQKLGFMNHSLDYHCRVNVPHGFNIGTRWAHPQHGYCPLGAFQLWSQTEDEWRGVRIKDYAHAHGNACRTDIQFSLRWDRHKRGIIPELFVAHLMSERAPKGVHWQGDRKTKLFGPDWLSNVPKNIGS